MDPKGYVLPKRPPRGSVSFRVFLSEENHTGFKLAAKHRRLTLQRALESFIIAVVGGDKEANRLMDRFIRPKHHRQAQINLGRPLMLRHVATPKETQSSGHTFQQHPQDVIIPPKAVPLEALDAESLYRLISQEQNENSDRMA